MANLYKDADKRKKVAPGGAGKTQGAQKEEPAVVTPAEPETPQEAPVAAEPVAETKEVPKEPEAPKETSAQEEAPSDDRGSSIEDVLKTVVNPRANKKKGYSLYLSESVMKEATKRAKAAGYANPAPYIDEILKIVFKL